MNIIIFGIMSLQLMAMGISFFRLWKGPSQADRVLIFDLLSAIGIALMLTASIFFDSQLYLDIALLMGLVSFAGTIGFTYFLEKEKCQ